MCNRYSVGYYTCDARNITGCNIHTQDIPVGSVILHLMLFNGHRQTHSLIPLTMLKVLCGVMNESVIHLYTTHDPIGSYAGVWLDIPDKSDQLHGVAPPFKLSKFTHFTASEGG